MSNENEPYTNRTYFGIALDPIHIGTGGYRLGRVDNTIARDAATNLPIIFGSSIEGTARTYAYYCGMNMKKENKDSKKIYSTLTSDCAGKGDPKKGKYQCGTCAVCVAFGYTEAKNGKSLHGMAQFSDAKILFFPVHTIIGPVWVTSPQCLKEFSLIETVPEGKMKTNVEVPHNKLNLGWLYLEKEGKFSVSNNFSVLPQDIKGRAVLVSDNLFHQIVNSNLEVRTSVSINPQTGAAEEGALFTYEAIPRTTIMHFDVVYNNPKYFEGIPDTLKNTGTIIETVKTAFCLFEHLGIGGMGTRGFGRFKILNLEVNCNATPART